MENLFSMFDPSTSTVMSLNWFTLLVLIILVPSSMYSSAGRINSLLNCLVDFLKKDFSMAMGVGAAPLLVTFLCSLFMFILSLNFLGLMPYVFTSSSNMSVTLSMSVTVWLFIQIGFLLNSLNSFLAHLVPLGTPGVLIPFMVYIELISNIIRPLTLAVRLAANMVAGHLLICLVNGVNYLSLVLPVVLLMGVTLMTLEMGVVFIQAYVFSTLSSLYCAELNETLSF